MTPTVIGTPLKGDVTRGIDFNLKKEDLMLLILEGRKEVMEEEIQKIQNKVSELEKEKVLSQQQFDKKVKDLVFKSVSVEAQKQADLAGNKISLEKAIKIDLSTDHNKVSYTKFLAKPVGEGKSGGYIKHQYDVDEDFWNYNMARVDLTLYSSGVQFAKKGVLYLEDINPELEGERIYRILRQDLNTEYLRTLPEWKKLVAVVTELAKIKSHLSEILAEYDLFNRNQPRSKAKMIKEVLERDAAGQEMLNNIISAAKSVKLLG